LTGISTKLQLELDRVLLVLRGCRKRRPFVFAGNPQTPLDYWRPRLVAYFEDVSGQIRRMVARETAEDISNITDDFRWIEKTTPEDAGWFLARIQRQFAKTTFFKTAMTDADLEQIATVGGLVKHVESELRKRAYI